MNEKKNNLYLLFNSYNFCGLELTLNYLLNHLEKCPEKWKDIIVKYYTEYDTYYIQLEKEMAKYDSLLFYTLKPGEFTFYNREFSTPFFINSIGVRDDEKSLEYPKVVMLGDSYGMGFGVNQDKTYASLVEEQLGIKVLNTAISSYGTPREIELLKRVNTDSMEYLIIQYCPNDYFEISEYLKHNNELIISTEVVYDSICEYVRNITHYYPFKTTKEFLPILFFGDNEKNVNKFKLKQETSVKSDYTVEKGFLDLIRNSPKIHPHTKIYVFTLDGKGFSNDFLEAVEKILNLEYGSSLHDRITFLDFSKVLKPENYFILDVHINSSANKIIADTLIKHIREKPKGNHEKKWYYDNGNLSIYANYFNHFKQGLTTYYWPNGNVSMKVNYNKGLKDGLEISFDKNGKQSEIKEYKNGVLK